MGLKCLTKKVQAVEKQKVKTRLKMEDDQTASPVAPLSLMMHDV